MATASVKLDASIPRSPLIFFEQPLASFDFYANMDVYDCRCFLLVNAVTHPLTSSNLFSNMTIRASACCWLAVFSMASSILQARRSTLLCLALGSKAAVNVSFPRIISNLFQPKLVGVTTIQQKCAESPMSRGRLVAPSLCLAASQLRAGKSQVVEGATVRYDEDTTVETNTS